MAQENLVKLITWLRAKRHPCYALLPANEYDKKWRSWNLPLPDAFRRNGSATLPRLIAEIVQLVSLHAKTSKS
jgi:hypothetical protein